MEKIMKLKRTLLSIIIVFLLPALPLAGQQAAPEIEKKGQEVRLEVIKAKLIKNGIFLDVHFRIRGGVGKPNVDSRHFGYAYVIEESTGEKFYVQRFAKFGALGQKRLDEGPISIARIDNEGGKIRKYLRVTFVIGGLRQEHILVEE
jgi:hypothetical protein